MTKIWYTNSDRTQEWQVDSLDDIPEWGIPHKRAFRKRPKQSEVMKGHKGYWESKKMPPDSRGETLHQQFASGERVQWNKGLSDDPRCKGHKPGEPSWNKGLTAEEDERVQRYVSGWRDGTLVKKSFETKKKNGTIKSSRPEMLLIKYYQDTCGEDDVIPHYSTDERYPFQCDIYIKSLDKFIELDGTWTHGEEPFDPTNSKHLDILEEMKKKSETSDYYKNAIYDWTVRDVNKRSYVDKNKLNFERLTYREEGSKYIYSNGIEINFK